MSMRDEPFKTVLNDIVSPNRLFISELYEHVDVDGGLKISARKMGPRHLRLFPAF